MQYLIKSKNTNTIQKNLGALIQFNNEVLHPLNISALFLTIKQKNSKLPFLKRYSYSNQIFGLTFKTELPIKFPSYIELLEVPQQLKEQP